MSLISRVGLADIFAVKKPLIGNVHCLPFPGTPAHRGESVKAIIDQAVTDAIAYAEGGMDGLLIENHGDIPFLKPAEIGPETVAVMTAIVSEITRHVDLPFGIDLLANYPMGALAVAKATGGRFVRANQWVNAYVSNEGFMEGESARILRYRKMIDAADIAVFADVHVKHGSHAVVGDKAVSEQARDVEFYSADVAIATGNHTGDSIPPAEIAEIRKGTSLSVIGGSGVTAKNAGELMPLLDGAIVGSSLKRDGVWWNPVERDRVEALVGVVKGLR
ncbi:BtpA/SgcQ family protein [Arsenicitalea aurantiaca]|uniref:BtpA/SgcQ family protein n=1 Tax=Arsenicitalea aurantiaca TaxID=1783274 RepID=A0A433X2P6_9HYPH|nr:BtpA/SgcQ family protein [Arsenicitalea aurantiaca]RUT28359.1 BtpA/SgcQ family protein [Arsenicitalea aurantiaca]